MGVCTYASNVKTLDFTIIVIFPANILCRLFLPVKFAVVGLKQTGEDWLSLVAAVYSAHFLRACLFYGCPQFCTVFSESSASSHGRKWEPRRALSFEQCVAEGKARHLLDPADAFSTFGRCSAPLSFPSWVFSLPWLSWKDRTCTASCLCAKLPDELKPLKAMAVYFGINNFCK